MEKSSQNLRVAGLGIAVHAINVRYFYSTARDFNEGAGMNNAPKTHW